VNRHCIASHVAKMATRHGMQRVKTRATMGARVFLLVTFDCHSVGIGFA
jgi:hypothetical protein